MKFEFPVLFHLHDNIYGVKSIVHIYYTYIMTTRADTKYVSQNRIKRKRKVYEKSLSDPVKLWRYLVFGLLSIEVVKHICGVILIRYTLLQLHDPRTIWITICILHGIISYVTYLYVAYRREFTQRNATASR